MLVYVSFDGDGIGKLVGRARLADNVEEVRKVNQRIDRGNEIWKSFALRVGGSIIEIGGDEGALEIPADSLDELPAIAEQYAGAVEATVSVGVGMKLSEASKALLVAKLQGKDRILFYTDEMEKAIAEAQKDEGTEADKLADEYLDKAELNKANTAMNAGPGAGFIGAHRASAPTVAKPTVSQGDHEEGQALYDLLSDDRPAPPEQTHAAKDFERQLHEEAWKGEEEDMAGQAQQQSTVEQAKAQVVQALQAMKAQGQVLEQLKQAAPQAYQAMMVMTQAVIGMARSLSPQGTETQNSQAAPRQDMAKSEVKYCTACKDPLDEKGRCKVKAHWAELGAPEEPVEKAGLPMPSAKPHHEVTLPVGSQVDQKLKVQHQDGTSSWKQLEAGAIRSMDPAGHATSSRSPNSK